MKQKKAAVYDRWLFTLGGGEQVAFAYAETLRDLGYVTSLITHQEIDIDKAEHKMGVNLNNIKLVYLPMMSSEQLSEFTEKYDIFTNTSYLDYFPNRSACGLLSIFFPSQIFLTPYEYLKRAVVLPSLSNFFIYPSRFSGFRYDEYKEGCIYKWLGSHSSIVFNKDIGKFSITLFLPIMTISLIERISFFVDDLQIYPTRKAMKEKGNLVEYFFGVEHIANKKFTIQLPSATELSQVALVRLTIPSIRYVFYNLFKQRFPTWEMRLHGGPGVTKLSDLTSYNTIVTISEFSRKWIKKYWGLGSDVLYPPVHTHNFHPASQKKNWIVHVGRFFTTGHCKKQLDLVKSFRTLVDEYKVEGWELHFIGSVHEGENHQAYFRQVETMAQGYPVFLHLDAPINELRSILSEAKIYWYATGLDEDEKRNPILFEHFGITTVEAMASGCVPIVINAGGQKEIVIPGSGILWNNRKELCEQTYQFITNPKMLSRVRKKAIERSAYFDRTQFKRRFQSLLQAVSNMS